MNIKLNKSNVLQDILNSISSEQQNQIELNMIISARLHQLIEQRGWNKHKFSTVMNKHPSKITDWLSGTYTFTSNELKEITNCFNIEVSSLYSILKID